MTSAACSARLPLEITPRARLSAALSIGFTDTVSNQGSYDAGNARFLPGFYNFTEYSAGPELRLSLGDEREPIALSLAGSFSHRRYPNRPAQDGAGAYGAQTLYQRNWTISTTLSYPMAPRLRLLFNLQAGKASSNQGFEQFYSYNYSATNYLMGFSYEY